MVSYVHVYTHALKTFDGGYEIYVSHVSLSPSKQNETKGPFRHSLAVWDVFSHTHALDCRKGELATQHHNEVS